MIKRIIISGKERVLNPYISFILSFFFTGTGEVYAGAPQRGIILALLRTASALAVPFYSITNAKSSHLTEVFFSLLFFTAVTLFSPFNALIISFKKKKIIKSKFITPKFIILFVLCNLIITLISIAVFFSFFSIIRTAGSFPPIIEQGDIAVVKKIGNPFFRNGEMIVLNNGKADFARIIGQPGETISYSKGRFSNQGSELFLSIFSENELKNFSLTDFDVISETGGSFKYPVIQNRDQYKIKISLKDDQYFAAPDDRNDISGFAAVKSKNIYGRMEGLLFSVRRTKLLIKPFQISE